MSEHDTMDRHARRGLQFLLALERGDAAALADLWQAAEQDAELEALLLDLTLTRDPATGPAPRATRPLPPLPEIIVRHDTEATGGLRDAGPVKKAR